jgi:hypothetical protein
MQPYFLPYIGYWQLLASVDCFIIYDNIKYTKKGWVNRNRFLRNGQAAYFSLPLRRGSDSLDIADRALADDFDPSTMLRQLAAAYRRAPQFDRVYPVLETIVMAPARNLFDYLHHSLRVTARFLSIDTPIVASSTVPIDHELKAESRVIALCRELGARRYINLPGGRLIYTPASFAEFGIELEFIEPRPIAYRQFGQSFVPSLSVLDVMMFNAREEIRRLIGEYDLT